jgi:hypothetical protein
MRVADAELTRLKGEVAVLGDWLSRGEVSDEGTAEIETDEQLLADLIGRIQKQRELEKELAATTPAPSPTPKDGFAQQFRRTMETRLRRIASGVQKAQDEVKVLTEDVREEEERIQLEVERKTCPPKISHARSQIAILEKSVADTEKRTDKRRAKVATEKERLKKLTDQLDLPRNEKLLRTDLCQRVERSVNWLIPNIRKQKRTWSETNSGTALSDALSQWDAKVLDASVNEGEDLALRGEAFRPNSNV